MIGDPNECEGEESHTTHCESAAETVTGTGVCDASVDCGDIGLGAHAAPLDEHAAEFMADATCQDMYADEVLSWFFAFLFTLSLIVFMANRCVNCQ